MEQLHLTELFDLEILKRLQDSFFSTFGISTGVSDENGVAVIEHASNCEFCSKYTKGSEEGLKRCQLSDKRGAELAMQCGTTKIYTCHAGLTDFAAPIMLDGRFLGCFLGGQVLTEPLTESKVREYAKELGIPPAEYLEAAKHIPMMTPERVENIAQFLCNIVDMFSHMEYQHHIMSQTSEELEKEAHMKSDFLANMSHEIRTPMNAVIGMAEMALREDLPPAAREYITQIMASGNTLLTIINDILDFSKIESGKMNINMVEYDLLSVVKDVSSVIMTRIGDKDLEFVLDVDPDIPGQLMGDSNRIRQIVINLANNAVKFTKEGCVTLSICYEKKSDWEIILKVSVKDTGIGIKKSDLNKLFQSFQQLDSKRNRNIEGTGLGLAISKQLVTLMNGKIGVESEYGEGSCFYFEIPQVIVNGTPCVKVDSESRKTAGLLCGNLYITENMKKIFERLNVECVIISKPEELSLLEEKGAQYFFIDSQSYTGMVHEFMTEHTEITGVLMTEFREQADDVLENVMAVHKPLYVMNVAKILSNEDLFSSEENVEQDYEFIAPQARVLIVDDNELNLTVAEGILAPLQMQVDKADSGKQAIDMISETHYDIIFMDHMMPELDGIETTRIIRRFHEEYDNVPIIALTANVMEDMRSMFLVEGMNDFVAKPIEFQVIVEKVKHWLPADKINKIEGTGLAEGQKDDDIEEMVQSINIPELDVALALQLAGSEQLFWQILKEYTKVIPKKSQLIQQKKEENDWKNYTIEVHALKSASKQVGAVKLSELAAELERAGKENDIPYILDHHDEMMEKYLAYEPILAKYIEKPVEEELPKTEYNSEKVWNYLNEMQDAADNLDMDAMDQVVNWLVRIDLPKDEKQFFEEMKDAVEELDTEVCDNIIREWKICLGKK